MYPLHFTIPRGVRSPKWMTYPSPCLPLVQEATSAACKVSLNPRQEATTIEVAFSVPKRELSLEEPQPEVSRSTHPIALAAHLSPCGVVRWLGYWHPPPSNTPHFGSDSPSHLSGLAFHPQDSPPRGPVSAFLCHKLALGSSVSTLNPTGSVRIRWLRKSCPRQIMP